DRIDVLCVKGSGWDLDSIEPEGFPALDLGWLRKLRKLEALSDEEMVNQLRTHLFDASAPNPSVETLLHAFLPHAFVDHTHADAVLALTNQPDGAELIRRALGDRVLVVPYVMPGFRLAKLAAEIFEGRPDVDGMVLLEHRATPEILGLLEAPECASLASRGPLTPDHVIRTKSQHLFVAQPALHDADAFRTQLAAAIDGFRKQYDAYFARQVAAKAIT